MEGILQETYYKGLMKEENERERERERERRENYGGESEPGSEED